MSGSVSHEEIRLVGARPGTLDSARLTQTQELVAEVRFNSRVRQIEGLGILATGPSAADAPAVHLRFKGSLPDGWWVICDDNLAPQGYACVWCRCGGTV